MATSETVRSTERDPIAVASILEEQRKHSETMAQLLGSYDTAVAAAVDDKKKVAEAATASGDAQAAAAETQGEIAVAKAEKSQDIMSTFGVNVSDPESAVSQARQRVTALRVAQDRSRENFNKLESISFLDNPLAWIGAKLEQSNLQDSYRRAAIEEATLNRQIDNDQRQAAAEANVDLPNVILETRRLAAQTAEVARTEAAFRAAQANSESTMLAASKLQSMFAMHNTDYMTRQQIALRLMETQTITDRVSSSDKKLVESAALLNLKLQSLGLEPYSADALKGLAPARRDALIAWGQKSSSFGNGPGDTLMMLKEVGGMEGLRELHPTMFKTLNEFASSSKVQALIQSRSQQDPKFNRLSRDEQLVEIMDDVATDWNKAVSRSPDGRMKGKATASSQTETAIGFNNLPDDNPFRLRPSMVAGSAQVQISNPLNDWVKGEISRDPLKKITDVNVVDEAVRRALADPTPEAIKKLSAQSAKYFRDARNIQYDMMGLKLMGMQTPEDYIIAGIAATQGTKKQLQALDPAEWEHLFLKAIADQKRASAAPMFLTSWAR